MVSPRLDFPKILAEVCKGDKDAFSFCEAFLVWAHALDDAIDGDKPLVAEDFITANVYALTAFGCNPFWLKHRATLQPLVVQGAMAYADSNDWTTRPDFRDRATADVLKSQYQEVLWYVALLTGGWDHYQAMTQKYRTYDYDAKG